MEELKCALLGYFGDRITPNGLSPEAASNCDPAQVTFINEAISAIAQHIPLIRAFCEANDLGRLDGFVARSFALACRDLLESYENAVLENVMLDNFNDNDGGVNNSNNNCCVSLVELKTAFGAVLARCSDLIRNSTSREVLASLLMFEDDDDDDAEISSSDQEEEEDNDERIPHRQTSLRSKILRKLPKGNSSTSSKQGFITVAEKWNKISQILTEPLLPSPIRASMGMKIHKTLVVNIAHWVCYGNIIEDHHHSSLQQMNNSTIYQKGTSSSSSLISQYSDFFVVQLKNQKQHHQSLMTSSRTSTNNTHNNNNMNQRSTPQGEIAIDEWKIPYGFPVSLCTTILIAGKERRQLDLILKHEKEEEEME